MRKKRTGERERGGGGRGGRGRAIQALSWPLDRSSRRLVVPVSSEVQTFNHQIFVEGPGALRYSLVARSKKAVQSAEVAEWLSAASLRVQGRLFETVT